MIINVNHVVIFYLLSVYPSAVYYLIIARRQHILLINIYKKIVTRVFIKCLQNSFSLSKTWYKYFNIIEIVFHIDSEEF